MIHGDKTDRWLQSLRSNYLTVASTISTKLFSISDHVKSCHLYQKSVTCKICVTLVMWTLFTFKKITDSPILDGMQNKYIFSLLEC